MDKRPYRPCAGFMLANKHSQIFVGQRIDTEYQNAWQMPQGGLDPGEDAEVAALRELKEETGVGRELVKVISRTKKPFCYDLPPELSAKLWDGMYRGQEQHWFLGKFTGKDSDINLEAHTPPEFSRWKWAEVDELPQMIVPFKKEVYLAVIKEFHHLL